MDTKYLTTTTRKQAKRALRNPHVQQKLDAYRQREGKQLDTIKQLREENNRLHRELAHANEQLTRQSAEVADG